MLPKSLVLVYTSILVFGERRIQARCENSVKAIVKFIRKEII
jgi:hypothetical protein